MVSCDTGKPSASSKMAAVKTSRNLGDRHKVRSFYNNILNPMSDRGDVTIDTHAVAAGLLQPLGGSAPEVSHNLGTAGDTSSITGVMGSYGILADAYREAAAEVGILPREMQSITWEAVRGLFANFKNPKNVKRVKDIWKKYDKGAISLDEARGEINAIAGGINRAAWERGPGPDGTGGDPGRRGTSTAENRSSGDAESYLALAHPEDEPTMPRWSPGYPRSSTSATSRGSSTPLSDKLSENYWSGPTVRPKLLSGTGQLLHRSRRAARNR